MGVRKKSVNKKNSNKKNSKSFIAIPDIMKIAIVCFFARLAFAFSETVWALYINDFVHNISFVGFISGFL
ncbi:hypothetical protein GF386_06705, partial [Candidatus Pacearchaeota archaeon]|nr:hypothetical protein [Candidatus Pacearchaeota archaeon]